MFVSPSPSVPYAQHLFPIHALTRWRIQIALWYNHSKTASQLASTIATDFNVKVLTYQIAVEDYAAVEKGVADVVRDFGRLDVMIANAGIPTKAGGLDDRVEDWNRVRAIDFDGAYYCARAAGLVFREQGCKSPISLLRCDRVVGG
jgi:sorbose reductase